ncbi:hypothetical protein BASA62_010426 [Batrachochytrium salamandrivorans]|nr:hypothetical protein BASA62_010426 [Batrachochytrium salamandrivorans]
MVDRHIRRLDEDLARFEEEQMTGPKVLPVHNMARDESKQHRSDKNNRESGSSRHSRRTQPVVTAADTPTKRRRLPDEERPPLRASPVSTPVPSTPQKTTSVSTIKTAIPAVSKKTNVKSKKASGATAPVPAPTPAPIMEPEIKTSKDSMSVDLDIDPNEPTYCICKQVSFGEMIACDNDDCPIEWFHYTCVGLTDPVKGKWFCPICVEKRKK